jgi:hypothetical protein
MSERLADYKNNALIECRRTDRSTKMINLRRDARSIVINRRRKLDPSDDLPIDNLRKRQRDTNDEILIDIQHEIKKIGEILTTSGPDGLNFNSLRQMISTVSDKQKISHILEGNFNFGTIVIDQCFLYSTSFSKYEILWMMVNITASADQSALETFFACRTQFLCYLPDLISCSRAEDIPLSCLACWIVGNVANSSTILRCQLIGQRVIERITELGIWDKMADQARNHFFILEVISRPTSYGV